MAYYPGGPGDEPQNQNQGPIGGGAGPVTTTGEQVGQGEFGTEFRPWETVDSRPEFSQDQWKAWEQFRDAKCPGDAPYRSERTFENGSAIGGCHAKPVDCPGGYTAYGDKYCIPSDDPRAKGGGGGGGGGTGGGGGGGGAGGGGGVGSAFFDPAAGMSGLLGSTIGGILAGNTRFSPEVMARLQASGKATEQARIARETTALRENLAQRGLAFSPTGVAQETAIRAGAAESYDEFVRKTEVQKAVTDFEDKMTALGAGLKWVSDLRSYYAKIDSNNVQREQIAAQLELGYANINARMKELMLQLESNKELLGMQLDSKEWQVMQQTILCLNLGMC